MKFQLLISTTKSKALSDKNLNSEENIIIDQQSNYKKPQHKNHIITESTGLSASRNIAIKSSQADIILFSDDDVKHTAKYAENIINAFRETDADIITFKIKTPDNEEFKEYKRKPFSHNKLSIFKVNSIEIAAKRKSLVEKKIFFDEAFGLGSKFKTGEENIFLFDALKAGLKIAFHPETIVIHPKESSGSNLKKNQDLIKSKGAVIRRTFQKNYHLIILIYSIKHYKKSDLSILEFISLMFRGAKSYKSTIIQPQ